MKSTGQLSQAGCGPIVSEQLAGILNDACQGVHLVNINQEEKMTITVVISTWQVPFDQTVQEIVQFGGDTATQDALAFINTQSAKWWAEHEGNRYIAENGGHGGYEPIAELGYNMARYELWGGESGFHAMLGQDSYERLHEEHYAREFDDKGKVRPGYLINAYVAGHKPGKMTEAEAEQYRQQQAEGMAAIESKFGDHTKQ